MEPLWESLSAKTCPRNRMDSNLSGAAFYNQVSIKLIKNCHKFSETQPHMAHGTHSLYKSDLRSPTLWPSSVFVKKFITVRNWANSINSSRLTESNGRISSVGGPVIGEMHLGNVWNYMATHMDLYGTFSTKLQGRVVIQEFNDSCTFVGACFWGWVLRWVLRWITPLPSVSKRLVNLYGQTIRLHDSFLHEGIEFPQVVNVSVVNTQIFLQKSNGHKMANSRPPAFLFSHLHCVFLEIPLAAGKRQN